MLSPRLSMMMMMMMMTKFFVRLKQSGIALRSTLESVAYVVEC